MSILNLFDALRSRWASEPFEDEIMGDFRPGVLPDPLPLYPFDWWWERVGFTKGIDRDAAAKGWDACLKYYGLDK